MTIDPKISAEGREQAANLAIKFIGRLNYQPALKIRGEKVKEDLKDIAAEDLQSNYPGIRGAFLAELRLRIDQALYEDLLDDSLMVVANSREVEDLAQNVADRAIDPAVINSSEVRTQLSTLAKDDLGGGLKAVRGAFLAELEARLPHHGKTYTRLLDGPLSFLTEL